MAHHFCSRHNISIDEFNKKVSVKVTQCKDSIIYTFTAKLNKDQTDDQYYLVNPDYVSRLPRACSYIEYNCQLETDSPNLIIMEGCRKFTGYSKTDEDPENDEDHFGLVNSNLFDINVINSWNNNNELEIVMTEKANGKFAILKIYKDMIICGSKNYHILFAIKDIDETINENKNNNIMYSILCDIKNNLHNLQNIREKFDDGYSLVGELCDGQHFVPGDNTIAWFGLFKDGIPMETVEALDYLNNNKIKTVEYSKVFDPTSTCSVESIINSARCLTGEGYVLRCRNIVTNETILVKVKAISYIVKRFFRQVLLRGYKNIYSITNRFIDACEYHQLNTDSSVRITNILIKFGMWMMSKTYPVLVLGHIEIKSIRGHLENGFNKYWQEFLIDTGSSDIIITDDDFGAFDKNEYLSNVYMYDERSYSEPVTVVFLQGLQGSGKSTIANSICSKLDNTLYLEQDMFWSCTLSCQGALYHNIRNGNGPKVIIVSRCNINDKQYKKYLDICHELATKIIFISPEKMDELDVLLSFQGILNRSQNGDSLMIGRHEMPIKEVTKFVLENFSNYQVHLSAHLIKTRNDDDELLLESKKIIKVNGKSKVSASFFEENVLIEYVKNNFEKIKSLRLDIEEITNNIINIITNPDSDKIIKNPKPSYIGLYISEQDRLELNNFVNSSVCDDVKRQLYNHHITLEFKPKDLNKSVQPYTRAIVKISSLVINKNDNNAAYSVSSISIDGKVIPINNPHITAKIKSDHKPSISQSFVGLTDETVDIIEYKKTINTVCFWSC